VVGNILVPIVGVEHGQTEISWFFFSVGFVFWLVLQTIIFNRVIFHHPLPEKMIPTLFILIAPPAVGFIAYVKLTGGVDNFARLLYYFALFIVLLLIALYRQFCSIQFYLSWWAYSFPVAAITIASTLMFHKTQYSLFQWLSWGLLALLVGIIFMLALKTLREVVNGRICVEE
jgi:tellurite resistance protein